MNIHEALVCGCIHESGYITISVHTTKKGAYRACRAWWLEQWNDWNCRVSGDGIHDGYPSTERRRDHTVALAFKDWKVKTTQVIED